MISTQKLNNALSNCNKNVISMQQQFVMQHLYLYLIVIADCVDYAALNPTAKKAQFLFV